MLGVAKQKTENVEVEAPNSELGIVSLIQAVKMPARYQALVRVQVTNNVFGQQQLIFEPLLTNEENYCSLVPRPWFLLTVLINLI